MKRTKYPTLDSRSDWVEKTLAGLSPEQKVQQLISPILRPQISRAELRRLLDGKTPGGVCIASGTAAEISAFTAMLQAECDLPVLVGTDLENGPGRIVKDATQFPDLMGMAASGSEDLAYAMGESAAWEGRACGIHWNYGPVVDINAHPHNPITNTRSWGDSVERIARLSAAFIRGQQDHGLCATAKHFPGDGFDDRDQHLATTINPLTMEQWFRLSGRAFAAAYAAGAWSTMVGHIALPAWDPGDARDLQSAPPATISRRLTTDLLRGELGFTGVAVSDAMCMAGVTSRGPREQILVDALLAGCDLLIFLNLKGDYDILHAAVTDGRLPMARVDEAVRRLLRLKEVLGIHRDPGPRPCPTARLKRYRAAAAEASAAALTAVRVAPDALPIPMGRGKRLLSVHVRGDAEYHVDDIDKLLAARGARVDQLTEVEMDADPYTPIDVEQYDGVLFHFVFGPNWGTDRVRLGGRYMRRLWTLLEGNHPHFAAISYGSPYHLYDLPHLPTLLNAYSPNPDTQRAVIRWLRGEIPARGRSPVDLDRPWRLTAPWARGL